MTIRIESDHALSISTDRPVSITSDGGTTTLRIEAATAPASGLASVPREKPAETMLDRPRCGKLMARSGNVCARIEGHNGVHMSAEQIERKQDYNRQRARDRYQNDPEYREAVKAGSRASHDRRKGSEPATE